MNRTYRVVWNSATGTWQAVAETACGRGKHKSAVAAAGLALLAALIGGEALAQALPTGGRVAAGTGTVGQSGSTLTVNQSSSRLALDWQTFSVGQGATVNFVQPSSTSVVLNRVLGADVSVIQGAVKANGQVFLLNPNGVLFTPTAQVNAGAIVASTLQMSTDDFMAGRFRLAGSSSASVTNQGSLTATGGAEGGAVALIAARVVNTGSIVADRGAALLAAASDVTLDLGGPAQLQVNAGVLDALVDNGGAIRADGGRVYLTAKAVNELASATVNNSGVIRAQTLATGEKGEIRLIADMQSGTANVGGTLDATAPNGGDGGFIETSANALNIGSAASVTTVASQGRTGTWLLDPDTLQIVPSGGVALGSLPATGISQISTTTLDAALATSNVALQANNYIDLQTNFTYTGARAASLGFLTPGIQLGGNIASSNAALSVTFGDALTVANRTNLGNVYLYGGARSISTNGGDVTFNGNLGGGQNLTIDTRSASSTSGKITHNAVVNGTFTTLIAQVGTLTVTASGFNQGWISFNFLTGYIDKYTSDGGTLITGKSNGGTFPIPMTIGGAQLTGGADIPAGAVLNLNGTAGATLKVYFTDGKPTLVTTLDASGGGNANYTVPVGGLKNVERIEYQGANSSGQTYAFPGITYHAIANASPINNYVAQADTSGGQFLLNRTLSVAGSIDVSTQQFINSAGATALTPGTVWHVWSTNADPYSATAGSADSLGGLAYTFKQYNATYGTTTPAERGSGYLLSYAPTANLALTGTISKVYDGDNSATLAAANFSITGGSVGNDRLSLATANLPTTGTYNSKDVATATTVTAANVGASAISATEVVGSSTVNVYGYGVTANPTGAASITPASLQLNGANRTVTYNGSTQANSGATVSVKGSAVANGVNGTTVTTGVGTDSFTLSGYGSGKNASSTAYGDQLLLTANQGTLASNYSIGYGQGGLTINPAALGVALNATYNGTTSFTASGPITSSGSLTTGGTLAVAGLQGSDTLGGVTVDYASVSGATKVTGITGTSASGTSAGTTLWNGTSGNYIINGSANGSANAAPSAGANSSNANPTGTNVASLGKAALGIEVVGVYNGSTTLAASDNLASLGMSTAVYAATGLVNGEKITSLGIHDANVVGNSGNGHNHVTTASGTGGFDIANYQLGSSQNVAGGSAFAGDTSATPASTTNAVWLRPAPLGVTLSGATYSGSAVFQAGNGVNITAYGLLGQDLGAALTSATLNSANVPSANKVVAVTGTGTFQPGNYVLNGAGTLSNTATAGSGLTGAGATNFAGIAPRAMSVVADDKTKREGTADPALTYTITSGSLVGGDTLGSLVRAPGENPGLYLIDAHVLGNPNYTIKAADGALTITPAPAPAPAPAPTPTLPAAPIVVPNFGDNAVQALGAETPQPAFGGLNYLQVSTSPGAPAAPAAGLTSAGATGTTGTDTTAGTPGTAPAAGAVQASATSANAGALNFVQVPQDGQNRASALNVNDVTVPSARGPLDVFVVGTGLNRSGVQPMRAIGN